MCSDCKFFFICVYVLINFIFCFVENFIWGFKRIYNILENNKKVLNIMGKFKKN